MSRFSWRHLVGIGLCGVGLVLCVGAIVAVGGLNVWLRSTCESITGQIDRAMQSAEGRLTTAREGLVNARLNTNQLSEMLRGWLERKGTEQLVVRFEIEKKGDQLAAALARADELLEWSDGTLRIVSDLLALEGSSATEQEVPLIERIQNRIVTLRQQLTKAIPLVARLQRQVGDQEEETAFAQRLEQAGRLVVLIADALGAIEPNLQSLAEQVSAARTQLDHGQARLLAWIWIGTVVVIVILVWLAAGQVALGRILWRGARSEVGFKP